MTEAAQSFPSGHATAAFASCTFWALFAWHAASQGSSDSPTSDSGLLSWSPSPGAAAGLEAGADEERGSSPVASPQQGALGRGAEASPLARGVIAVRAYALSA